MKPFFLLFVAVCLSGVSCERHEFEGPNGTAQLNKPHGAGAHHEAAHTDGEHKEAAPH